jgi:hypothetical protein
MQWIRKMRKRYVIDHRISRTCNKIGAYWLKINSSKKILQNKDYTYTVLIVFHWIHESLPHESLKIRFRVYRVSEMGEPDG